MAWNLCKQVLVSLQGMPLQRIQSKSWIGSMDPSIVSCGTVCCMLGGTQVKAECPVAWNLLKQVQASPQLMHMTARSLVEFMHKQFLHVWESCCFQCSMKVIVVIIFIVIISGFHGALKGT